jgi:hypothetical protein
MNRKKVQYLLLFITLCIWGVVLYKVWIAWGARQDSDVIFTSAPADSLSILPDTFSLQGSYRDPFLEYDPGKEKTVTLNPVRNTRPVVKAPPLELQWPPVTYSGMIRNQGSGKLLAVVSVNGKSSLMGPGDVFEEVKIGKIYKDSVEVVYSDQKKIVRK